MKTRITLPILACISLLSVDASATDRQARASLDEVTLAQAAPANGRRGRKNRKARQERTPEEKAAHQQERSAKKHENFQQGLVEKAGLTPEKAAQVADIMKKHHEARRAHREAVKAEMDSLRKLIAEGAADGVLLKQMQAVQSMRAKKREASQDDVLDQTKGILTVKEQAKVMVAIPSFKRDMKKMKRRERKGKKKMRQKRTAQ